jgi:hypothetical protein
MRGRNLDVVKDEEVMQLLGTGRAVLNTAAGAVEWEEAVGQLLTLVGHVGPPGWSAAVLNSCVMHKYQHATLSSYEVLHSEEYLRTRAADRVSYLCLVQYMEGEPEQLVQYVARVKWFLKATPLVAEVDEDEEVAHESAETLRIAIADLFMCEAVDLPTGMRYDVPDMREPLWPSYPVLLDEQLGRLLRKLVSSSFDDVSASFALYANMSGCMELRDDVNVVYLG